MLKINKLLTLSAAALFFTMNSALALVGDGKNKSAMVDILTAQSIVLSDSSFVVRVKNNSTTTYNVVATTSYGDVGPVLPPFVNVDDKCNGKDVAGGATCDITYTAKLYYDPTKSFPAADKTVNVTIKLATNTEPKKVSPAYKFNLHYFYELYAHTKDGQAYFYNGSSWSGTNLRYPKVSGSLDSCAAYNAGSDSGGFSIRCWDNNSVDYQNDYFNGSQYCTSRGLETPKIIAMDSNNDAGIGVVGGCFWSKYDRNIDVKPYPMFNLTFVKLSNLYHRPNSRWDYFDATDLGVNADVLALTHSDDDGGAYEVVGGDFTAKCSANDYLGCTEGDHINHIAYFNVISNGGDEHTGLTPIGDGLSSSVDDVQFIKILSSTQ